MTGVRKHVVLASGGTGGHIFPARALAEELIGRNIHVTLMTDSRGKKYDTLFPGVSIVPIKSGSPSIGGIVGKMLAAVKIVVGTFQSLMILRKLKPVAVVGFGGYPSMPPCAAASLLNIPLVLHEQNAVLGRVNKLLAGRASHIATSFHHTQNPDPVVTQKMAYTGNPVRSEILKLYGSGYQAPTTDGRISVLVLGGSQGATVLSEVIPDAISNLPDEIRSRVQMTQQCRPEDLTAVRNKYAASKVDAELATFFGNIPDLLKKCHLAITRSGASTIAELTVAGRPAILVPYKYAMDDHQLKNAESEVVRGAAELVLQDDFTVETLTPVLESMLNNPVKLQAMAESAAQLGEIEAAKKLADLVDTIVQPKNSNPGLNGKVVA